MRIAALFLLAALPVLATTIHVPADEPTIQAGIDAADPGDVVQVAAGVYTGAGNLDLDFSGKDISVIGSGSESCIIELGDGHFGFRFENGESRDALLQGFRIQNGYMYVGCTGIRIDGASPTLKDLVLYDHRQSSMGNRAVGINCNEGSPHLELVQILACRGGGVEFQGGAPELTDVLIQGCSGGEWGSGGGLVCDSSSAILTRVIFLDNSTYWGEGGAMLIYGSPSPTLIDCVFSGNSNYDEFASESHGGAIWCGNSSPILQGVRFINNSSNWGGAMFCIDSNPTLYEVTFENNSSSDFLGLPAGGAIALDNSTGLIESCTFYGNDNDGGMGAYGMGGAIFCQNGSSPHIANSIISFCDAGPGIYADSSSHPTLECNDIFGNADGPFGGSMPDVIGIDGNISLDPMFCLDNHPWEPLSLDNDSPCAAANNDCGTLMGAYPVACDFAMFTLSGQVINPEGEPIAGVEFVGFDPPQVTDESGCFHITLLEGWSGRLLPRMMGFTFDPPWVDFENLSESHINLDFTGQRSTLHRVPEDHPDLRASITVALSGDTVLVAPGVYSGASNRDLDFMGKDLNLIAAEGSEETTIDCQSQGRFIYFHSGETEQAIVRGFKVVNGRGSNGGAIHCDNSSPQFYDVTIENSHGTESGGALCCRGESMPYFEDTRLLGNTTLGPGGAVSVQDDSQARFNQILVSRNISDANGGGFHCSQSSNPMLTQVTIVGNEANENGGGIFTTDDTVLLAEDCIIAFNIGNRGLYAFSNSTMAIQCCNAFGNVAGNYGGTLSDQTGISGNISENPVFCDPISDDYTLDYSSPCLPENNSCGVLMGAYGPGCGDPTESPEMIHVFSLSPNTPNPFNPTTQLKFSVPTAGNVSLEIFDVTGRLAATVIDDPNLESGWHTVQWSARDNSGKRLSSGVYFLRLEANGMVASQKMILMK